MRKSRFAVRSITVLGCLLLAAFVFEQIDFGIEPEARAAGLPEHHNGDGTFRNLYLESSKKSLFKFLWAKYTSDWTEWQDYEVRVNEVPLDEQTLQAEFYSKPKISWVGHSTVLIQYQNVNVLTDPIFSYRASPVSFAGPHRIFNAAVDIDQLPEIDYIVISHNHYDHLDLSTVEAIGDKALWVVPLGLAQWFEEQGVKRVVELDWWQALEEDQVTLRLTPAQHWSRRTAWDTNTSLWGSWQIQIDDFNSWFGGDTGYNEIQFKEIGQKHGPFDFAMIPIGAYEPRWFMQAMHVNPQEAVEIHKDIRSAYSMGVHWSTFQLTAEEVDAPRETLESLMQQQSDLTPFKAVPVGSSFEIKHLSAKSYAASE